MGETSRKSTDAVAAEGRAGEQEKKKVKGQ